MAGNAASGRKKETSAAVEKARRSLAQLNGRALEGIKRALDDSDIAIAAPMARWLLEMNLGKPKQATELTGEDGGPVELHAVLGTLSPAELAELRAALAARRKAREERP